jgi:hypothetical protein
MAVRVQVPPSAPTQAIARHGSLLARHPVYIDTSQMMIELAREER